MGIFFQPQEISAVVTGVGGGFAFLSAYSHDSPGGWELVEDLPFSAIFADQSWQDWSDRLFPAVIPPGAIYMTSEGGSWVADDYYDLLDSYFDPIGFLTSVLDYDRAWVLSGQATYGRRSDNLYSPAPDPIVFPTGPCEVQGVSCEAYADWPSPDGVPYTSWIDVLSSNYGGLAETASGFWWLLSHSSQAACDLVEHSDAYGIARCPREAWTSQANQSPESYAADLLTSKGIAWRYYKPYYYMTYVQVQGYSVPYGGQRPGFRRRKPGKKGFPVFPPLLSALGGLGGFVGLKVDGDAEE